ncbi:MAG: redoxin domain-containing protein [Chitinivibrionales bacterium]|nr:redoxin domain-containing protein [Chitinivibrionales bacterium]
MNKMILNKGTLLTASIALVTLFASLLVTGCGDEEKKEVAAEKAIKKINSYEGFQKVVNNAGDKLLVFDLYADWCRPCRILSPMLEQVAKEHKDKAEVYKINVDTNPQVARMFQVRGIPYVVFMKNKKAIHAVQGVQPKEAYVDAIVQLQ